MADTDVDALRASMSAISASMRELRAQKADDALIKEQRDKLAEVNRQIAALTKGDAAKKGPRMTLKTPKVRCANHVLKRTGMHLMIVHDRGRGIGHLPRWASGNISSIPLLASSKPTAHPPSTHPSSN